MYIVRMIDHASDPFLGEIQVVVFSRLTDRVLEQTIIYHYLCVEYDVHIYTCIYM